MAVFVDLENLAIGARDAKFPRFDIQKVLERLLLKGHIVVKKAYCDFDRYKEFKRDLHEAAFELIEIPHLNLSGKNSADIRMVVDALDLCYTKSHVDTFVIVSGDSDFSPLVSKLRENAKTVIGVGVKSSTSDLFLNNCDQFIYYDDLVRGNTGRVVKATGAGLAAKPPPSMVGGPDPAKAIQLVAETLEALAQERSADEAVWGSMIKEAIQRRHPGFNERAHGFKSFNALLLAAQEKKRITLEAHEKSGGYKVKPFEPDPF
ncbi:MAG TPA: NYN domain-containing protein [Verrucomicrobiales bacterium]|nr:NYN domain-containing protein [Verrucomicrobiales bacterium]